MNHIPFVFKIIKVFALYIKLLMPSGDAICQAEAYNLYANNMFCSSIVMLYFKT
jgi:hypothetical protein